MNLFSPDELLKAMDANVAQWKEAGQKITRFISKDPWHPYEIIATGPQGLCVIFHWSGADALGGEEVEGLTLATQKLEVFLSFNLGLTAQPSAALTQGTDARPSLLKLVGLLQRRIRSMDFRGETDVRRFFRWSGTEPVVTPDGIPLAAYKLKFELDTDVEELEPQET
jgi:hypothetical protein